MSATWCLYIFFVLIGVCVNLSKSTELYGIKIMKVNLIDDLVWFNNLFKQTCAKRNQGTIDVMCKMKQGTHCRSVQKGPMEPLKKVHKRADQNEPLRYECIGQK